MADQFSLRKKNNRRQGVPQDPREAAPYLEKPPSQHRPSQDSQRGRPSRDGNSPAPSAEPRPRPRERKDTTTANLVKKRYSIRYGQVPDGGFDAPPMPGVPQIPQDFSQQDRRRDGPAEQQSGGGLDKRALRDPNLQADQCLWYH
jgi:hypothetical protein